MIKQGYSDGYMGWGLLLEKLNKKDEDSDGNSVLSGDSNSQSGESDEGEDRKKEPPLKKHVFPGVATLIAAAGTIPTYKKRKRIFKLFRI